MVERGDNAKGNKGFHLKDICKTDHLHNTMNVGEQLKSIACKNTNIHKKDINVTWQIIVMGKGNSKSVLSLTSK